MLNIKETAEKFTVYLKQRKMQTLMCDTCGYTQGHPIVYCPKCPGKMNTVTSTEYIYLMGAKNPKDSLWYKCQCAGLLGVNRLTSKQWHGIIDKMQEDYK